MPEYLEAWKLFRKNSDENEVTAEHLLARPSWPATAKKVEICDVGCGDGRLLEEVLKRNDAVGRIRLVDPDADLLGEAEERLEEHFPGLRIVALASSIRDCWPKCAERADVVLAVHVVYLLEQRELELLIENQPRDAVTYVILDAPTSVFTQLWRITAAKYYGRAKAAHRLLRAHVDKGTAKQSSIRSRIPKSLFRDHELRDWLLSILCYCDMFTDVPEDLRTLVDGILMRHTDETGEFIECESICYELLPR